MLQCETPGYGQLKVCLNGLWGCVCGEGWDYRDAEVVCCQVGYDGRKSSTLCALAITITCIFSIIPFVLRILSTIYLKI